MENSHIVTIHQGQQPFHNGNLLQLNMDSMNRRIKSNGIRWVQMHAKMAQMEALPICGVAPSVLRCAVSIAELALGTVAYTISGGFCCIPWSTGSACTMTLAGMQVSGRAHIFLGLYGVFESALNIGSLGCYQYCFAEYCSADSAEQRLINVVTLADE